MANINLYAAQPFYQNAVNRMTQVLRMNQIEVYEGAVANAAATHTKKSLIDFGRPIIVYNPNFMAKMLRENKWAVYFVLAHEVSHHYNGDLHGNFMFTHKRVDERAHRQELNADYMAAWILRCEGASLAQTLAFYNAIDDYESYTHPSASERRQMAMKGWTEANCRFKPAPKVTPKVKEPSFGEVLLGVSAVALAGAALGALLSGK